MRSKKIVRFEICEICEICVTNESARDMSEREFKIRAYGKSELAMLYFPGDSPENALKKLRCWFAKNKKLKHFVSREKKYYTPKQVRIIIEELGEPDD